MRMVSGAMMMMLIHVFDFSFTTLPSSMDKCKPATAGSDLEKSIKRISAVHASNYSFALGL